MKALLKKKFKRTLAMLFAVAMTVTSIPQTAYAAEVNNVETTEAKETIAADGGVSGNSWEVTFVNDGNVTVSENAPTATEGTDYTFKAVANEGYENVTVAAYTTASYETDAKSTVDVTGPAEDVYTIVGAAITEAITVVVSATAQTPQITYYTVTKSAAEDAEIVYVENCVEETVGQPDRIVEGKVLEFIVNVADQAKEIDTVSCTVGGEAVTVNIQEILDGSIIYSIDAEDITGDVVISVTLKYKGSAQPTAYTVTTVAEGATVTYVDDCVAEGKITAGADLKFAVSANDTAKEVETVKYSMGDVADEALEADADGVYTVASVSDNVIITATLKDKEAPAPEVSVYSVTFEKAEGAVVTDLQVNGEAVEAVDGVLPSVSENDLVTFKVATEETHELLAVKAGETPIESVDGVYSVAVTEDVVISIETKAYNKVTFAVAGDEASYTTTVSGNEAITYEIGDILYTNEETVSVSLNEADGYKIDKVELGKEEQKKEDGSPLTTLSVTFTAEVKDYTVKVTTSPVASEENATVVFANASDYMTYAVTTNEKVVKVAGKSNTYDVFAGADYVKFTVTATGNYQPIVKLDGEELPFEKEKTKNGKTPYTFKVRANALNIEELNVITIEHELEDKMVTVSFAEDEVTLVSANVNGVKAEANVSEPVDGVVTASFAVPYGSTIKVTAEAKENCKMTKAVTTVGTKTKDEKIKKNVVSYSIKATDDASTVITSEKLYKVFVLDYKGIEVTPVKGVYNVEWLTSDNIAVGLAVLHGAGDMRTARVSMKRWELKDSNKNSVVESRFERIEGGIGLYLDKSDAGKTLVATITVDDETETVLPDVKFKVAPLATKVTVAGVKNGVLSQAADTTKEYALTYNAKGVSDIYAAEVVSVSDNEVVMAEITDGKLRITTLPTVGEKVAKIKIYNAAASTETEKVYLEGGEFDVTITEPAMMKVTPTVKLKSSDDVSLTLTLGAKKVDSPNDGKVYYKVDVTSAETDANIVNAIAKPFYIEKNGASQDAKIVVNNSAFGSGKVAKYNVKVTLVQTKDGEELTAENTEGKDVFTSNKYATKSNLKTKAAYYETNLKLKKGTTTVYTGQSNIVVATAKFGNKTTHTELMRAYSTANGVNSSLDATKQKVLVEVASDVKPGKYTITVEAKAPENTIPSKTSITINVVKDIQTIDVDMPCASVYKQDKKAVSVTAKAVFNKYQNYVPKSKKVTWSIVDKEGNELTNEDSLYGKISVKNGKVTVAKNYIVSNVETDNQFRVRATAADWKGNTVFGLSEVITITSATVELGEVILVDEVYDEIHWISQDIFNVVGRSGETVTADQIFYSQVVVLKKGTVEKDSYTREELEQFSVPSENVTFSVSNKAVKLDSEGYIETLDKPVKNVNITAKIMDGSNKKAVLSRLTINYAQVNDLSLKVYPTTPKEDDPTTLLYSADLPEILSVELCDRTEAEEEEGSYETIEDGLLVNYDFEIIEGANLVYFDKRNKSIAFLPTAKETKIKLVDKTKKGESAVKIYTLLNESWQETPAPKITVSGNDYLYAGYYPAKQTMTFKIDGTYSGNAVKVGMVDFSEEEWDFGYQLKVTGGGNVFDIAPDGTFTLEWERWDDNYTELVKGNYKIYVAFGNATRETTSYGYEWVKFTAETAPTAVTVKVKDPTITESVFHLDTSYKIYLRDGLSAQLTGTGKGVNMDTLYFNKVENINVNGQANKFADYFVLGDDHRSIKLRDNVNVDDITENDLKGYLSYRIEGDSLLNKGCSGTAQIKITLDETTTSQKYALSDLTVSGNEASDNMVAPYSVSGNAFVYVDDNTDNKAEASEVYCESEDFMVYVDNTRTLHFKNTKELEFGSYEVEAYVITNANLYDYKIYLLKQDYANEQDEVKKAELKAVYEKAIQTYGVKVKTTIKIEKAE